MLFLLMLAQDVYKRQERNQQLIDGSNYCIYYSDSKTAPYTQSIIDYAIDNGIWTTNLADNLLWGADDYFEHL